MLDPLFLQWGPLVGRVLPSHPWRKAKTKGPKAAAASDVEWIVDRVAVSSGESKLVWMLPIRSKGSIPVRCTRPWFTPSSLETTQEALVTGALNGPWHLLRGWSCQFPLDVCI